MPRLFIAVDLPPSIVTALRQIQPRPVPGLRLASAGQMHLTLHFIGEAETGKLIDALINVQSVEFSLAIKGVGKFPPRGAPSVLWAGIATDDGLLKLHAAIADALRAAGFPTETRPFAPHITLARCTRELAPDVADEFLEQHDGLSLPPFLVSKFHLYSSVLTGGTPKYFCERSFYLSPAGMARSDKHRRQP
jgi:2'-5' RNA ligase